MEEGAPEAEADTLAAGWMSVGDYQAEAAGLSRAAVVASVGRDAIRDRRALAKGLRLTAGGEAERLPEAMSAAGVSSWFADDEPWPCTSPERLALLKKLEEQFPPLESKGTGPKVGIGVATGADKIFITKDEALVEQSRLLPLAMASDIPSDGPYRAASGLAAHTTASADKARPAGRRSVDFLRERCHCRMQTTL